MKFTFIRKETNKQVNYVFLKKLYSLLLQSKIQPGLRWAGTHTEEGCLGTLDTSWVNASRWEEEAKWSVQ